MTEAEQPDVEARLRAEVERAVAPYVGRVPPVVLDKLREQAERYWRERPEAMRALQRMGGKGREKSGTEVRFPEEAAPANARAAVRRRKV